uniref:GRIP domain-containing protein n=1 Tax=Ascaris lumbricoides TaxID=6252 RepID=A0A9J2P961_ASCLU
MPLSNERARQFTFRTNAVSSDTSDEYIEATIDFSDAGVDTSSQRTLSAKVAVKVRRMDGRAHLLLSKRRLQNRSTEGGIHTRSSDDGSSVLGEGVNGELQPLPIEEVDIHYHTFFDELLSLMVCCSGGELRTISGPIASTSSLVSSASTSASSFYPAFNTAVSSDSLRDIHSRNDKLSTLDACQVGGQAEKPGVKLTASAQDDLRNRRRAQQKVPTIFEISAAQRNGDRNVTSEFSALWQDQNNKNTSNVLGKEVPCHQSPQATLASTNPQNAKLKSLHKENAALRRHLDEANNYVDTVEIENEQNFTTMSNRIDELYDVLDEKNRQLNVANARLSEKEQEISKLQERIKLLEKNNQRQQQVIELTREEASRGKEKLREAVKERAELLLRNASLFHQWSIERERLSMELNDVTRELDLQKMLLNGESISEIVQRWEVKVFELEGMVADRDAAIRAQQQRIGELKQAATRGGGELSSNESIISQQAATKTDPATLAHLKRILHQCSRSPTDEQYAQLVKFICDMLHLPSDDSLVLMEQLKRHTPRHPNSQALR